MLSGWPPGAPGPTLTLCIFLSVGGILTVLPEPPRDEQLLVECPPTLGSVSSGPRRRGTPRGHFTDSPDAQTQTHTYPEVLKKNLPHPGDVFHRAMSHPTPSLWAPC